MKILLDTQVLLWAATDDPRLSAAARALVESADQVFVSAASIWEVAIKASLGKLPVDAAEVAAALPAMGFEELPISVAHTIQAGRLPWHHRDPFDRLLVAQAIEEPLRLLTADPQLAPYSELVVTV